MSRIQMVGFQIHIVNNFLKHVKISVRVPGIRNSWLRYFHGCEKYSGELSIRMFVFQIPTVLPKILSHLSLSEIQIAGLIYFVASELGPYTGSRGQCKQKTEGPKKEKNYHRTENAKKNHKTENNKQYCLNIQKALLTITTLGKFHLLTAIIIRTVLFLKLNNSCPFITAFNLLFFDIVIWKYDILTNGHRQIISNNGHL